MHNFSILVLLLDSTIEVGRFLKLDNNFKIMIFNHYFLNDRVESVNKRTNRIYHKIYNFSSQKNINLAYNL